MADLEAVLADVSYLMAMEKSKSCPAARASKKIILPDPSVRWVMHKHLEKTGEATFDKIFHQTLGYLLFKEFCETICDEPVPQLQLYEDIKQFEKLDSDDERIDKAREIYDTHIMKDLLAQTHIYSNDAVEHVQDLLIQSKKTLRLPPDAFEIYKREICDSLSERIFDKFVETDKYTRYCQWKNFELNLLLTMNDFSVHRIIGRGGFGEVYGCRKVDTGKMYAMKCLDKKRIKLKCGESLAMNERNMLAAVSSGDGSPFIVCMTYAFQTSEKLCFVLDLMNGGDLHYHLSQHGVFTEQEARFYASEVLLGLEHMHKRSIVYRDLKPANILLDENGHVKISDLGLACDFSKKKPHASVGTHGYMAPEVLAKGVAYDSAADWFSFGCMLYKILRGHSPFRPPKSNKDKLDADKPLTMVIEMPDSFSSELRDLIEALLRRDPAERLGGSVRGADDVKEHPWFSGVDWQLASLQKYPPPIIPPRGEVNAADAFDIGNFDEEDTKGIKLTEVDQDYYRQFSLVVSNRWQQEIAETVFAVVNQEADKAELKKRSKPKSDTENDDGPTDCIVEGEVLKLEGRFMNSWEKRHLRLYPNRLEFYQKRDGQVIKAKGVELVSMLDIKEIHHEFQKVGKNENCIVILLKSDQKIVVTSPDKILITQWKDELLKGFRLSTQILSTVTPKVCRVYGAGSEIASKEPLSHSPSNGPTMSPSRQAVGAAGQCGHAHAQPQSQLQPNSPSISAAHAANAAKHSDSNENINQKSRQSSVDKER